MSETTLSPQREPAPQPDAGATEKPDKRVIKVLVWDLDNTLWDGTILEGDAVRLRPGVKEALATLDARGILQSVASKNDPEVAWEKLKELGVAEYFLYPQIGWNAKSGGIEKIAESINIGLDAVAFIDDQPFERDEVSSRLPQVMTLDASELNGLIERPELIPRFITDESAIRRKMYQADIERNRTEEDYSGPQEEFLAGLGMRFTVAPAEQEDLKRAEELTVRTNQLNTTGETYSYDELDAFRRSPDHLLLVASLVDRYGTYGKIGLALIEKGPEDEGGKIWTLKLLLMSCRVMARGVGTILLHHIMELAREAGARLQAEVRSTGRNRMMLVTFTFGGFKQVGVREIPGKADLKIYEADYSFIQPPPDYVEVSFPHLEG